MNNTDKPIHPYPNCGLGYGLLGNEVKGEDLDEKQRLQKERDVIRTKELIDKGFKILRLWENEINVMDIDNFKERLDSIG